MQRCRDWNKCLDDWRANVNSSMAVIKFLAPVQSEGCLFNFTDSVGNLLRPSAISQYRCALSQSHKVSWSIFLVHHQESNFEYNRLLAGWVWMSGHRGSDVKERLSSNWRASSFKPWEMHDWREFLDERWRPRNFVFLALIYINRIKEFAVTVLVSWLSDCAKQHLARFVHAQRQRADSRTVVRMQGIAMHYIVNRDDELGIVFWIGFN
jgi:hypothetical protein